MNRVLLLLTLICLLPIAGAALAMSSAGYVLSWYTPLTGSGGGA